MIPPALWPLLLAFLGYPLWWALGLAPFVWVAAAVPMAARLLTARDEVRLPRGFGLWLLYLAWVLVSISQVDTSGRLIGFGFRFADLLAATVIFIYSYNLPHGVLSARGGLRLLTGVWSIVVAGGWLAITVPNGAFPSLSSTVLPSVLTSNDFVSQLITPVFAQVHDFLGFPLPRPAAPFTYTNTWGAMFAIGLPFVAALALTTTSRRARWSLYGLLLAGTVPALLSVNRTMWGAVVVVLVLLAVTVPSLRIRRALRLIIAIGVLLLMLASATYIGQVVSQRLDTPHSNIARQELAVEATGGVLGSPWLGTGAPRPFEGEGIRPPVGTQGQLWFIAVSHGVPALALYMSWFGLVYARSRRGDPVMSPWFRASLVAALVVFPFYGLAGMPLNVLLLAAALSLRPPVRREHPASAERPVPAGIPAHVDPSAPPDVRTP